MAKVKIILSIVTITKDDQPGLIKTILSVKKLLQCEVIDHIIINGGISPITTKFKGYKHMTQIEYRQIGSGISNAFNQGISLAKGEWSWFLNGGDTRLESMKPEFLISYLKKSNADILIFDYIHGTNRIVKPPIYALWPPVYNWIPHPSTIIRTSVLKKYGGFNEGYKVAMDGELWVRLLARPDIRLDLISIPLTHFDTTGISSSSPLRAKESLRILWQYKATIFRRWLNSAYLTIRASIDYYKQSK